MYLPSCSESQWIHNLSDNYRKNPCEILSLKIWIRWGSRGSDLTAAKPTSLRQIKMTMWRLEQIFLVLYPWEVHMSYHGVFNFLCIPSSFFSFGPATSCHPYIENNSCEKKSSIICERFPKVKKWRGKDGLWLLSIFINIKTKRGVLSSRCLEITNAMQVLMMGVWTLFSFFSYVIYFILSP